MNRYIYWIISLELFCVGCTTVSINLDSDPSGASVYKSSSENGPWKRITGNSDVTPLSIKVIYDDSYMKAKKYGYDDSSIIKVSDLKGKGAHLFQLRKLIERRYDPFYETSITKVSIDSGRKSNIAVMNFVKKGNVDDEQAYYIAEFMQDLLLKTEAFNVLDRKNVTDLLKEIKFQMSGITTNENMVEVGKLLNVHEIVNGSIGHLNLDYIVTLTMIDVESGRILYTGHRTFRNDSDMGKSLVEIVNEMISKRFNK